VIGRGDRPDALNASFLNAVSANVLEYDDTHLGTVMHPAAPVAPGLCIIPEAGPEVRRLPAGGKWIRTLGPFT
jgi:2-methylcitrate dehydratase PrpD